VNPTEVDGGYRQAAACGRQGETKAGIDHKRRTYDEHRVGVLQVFLGQGDLITWDVFAEEHDVRLEDAAAGCARRHGKA
jgi:hypothetical protein